MANVDEDLDLDIKGAKQGSGKMKMILIISLVVLLLIGFSVTLTLLLLGGKDSAAPAAAPAATAAQPATPAAAPSAGEVPEGKDTQYMLLDPAFVVNLEGQDSDIRYLQISASVQVGSESDLEVVKKHMPVIRHKLNLLYSSLDFNDIRSSEGKSKLSEESLKVVQQALNKMTGRQVVQAVFFNSLVGQ